MNIIDQIDAEQMAEVESKRILPEFSPGDTVRVDVRVSEGTRTRVQAYEGVCIARAGGGLQENFTVRKISYGEGVERTFPIYSPMIEGLEVVRRGKVRRAKLYYLRERRGKSARIPEATNARARRLNELQKAAGLQSKSPKSDAEYQDPLDTTVEDTEILEANVENQAAVEENAVNQVANETPENNETAAESVQNNQTDASAEAESQAENAEAVAEADSTVEKQAEAEASAEVEAEVESQAENSEAAAADSTEEKQVEASAENQTGAEDSVEAKADDESDADKKSDA